MDTYSLPLQTVKLICYSDNISRGETAGDWTADRQKHIYFSLPGHNWDGLAGRAGLEGLEGK